MTIRRAEQSIGLMFLLAMACSIAGNLLLLPMLQSGQLLSEVASNEMQLRIYALLMAANSLAVSIIGILSFAILKRHSDTVAVSYLAIRLIEAVVLAVGILSILALIPIAQQSIGQPNSPGLITTAKALTSINWYAYHLAMISLGLGSLVFVRHLIKEKMLPELFAWLGILGYLVLAVTSMLSIADINLGIGVTLPVFVFEVGLGVYLLIWGFKK